MLLKSSSAILCIVIQFTSLWLAVSASQSATGENEPARSGVDDKPKPAGADNVTVVNSKPTAGLEARISDRNFVKDIVDRLHALDADIGKLLYNSTSMYAPNDQGIAQQESGGEKFTEVLNDLDSLQDEIGVLINNATRTRQYNILIRLRPLNNILYRIRHNLHLMRNSLVAINAVSSLEKIGNSVLDSTLQAFMKPDANLSEEIGDDGNYEINLDKLDALSNSSTTSISSSIPTSTVTPTTSPKPAEEASSSPATTSTTAALPTSSTARQSTTSRPTQRTATRRANHRQGQRRTQKPSTAKPDPPQAHRVVSNRVA